MEYPKRKPNRLQKFDYSTPHACFVTICTKNRRKLFWRDVGAITDRPFALNAFGLIAEQCIREIPNHYSAVSVDHYAILPNHIHLLLQIHTDTDGRSMIAPTISTVVRLMKGAVSKQAGFSVWQKGFYDHVIRSEADYREIWEYIEHNPDGWIKDSLFVP